MPGLNRKELFTKLKKKLFRKYRFVIMNDSTFEEKLSFKLSRINVFTLFASSGAILILLTVIIIAFTPLKEYIPGYSDIEDRNNLYRLSVQTDSLKRIVDATSGYMDSLLMVLSGTDDFGKVDYAEMNKYTNKITESSETGKGISGTSKIYESLYYQKPLEGIVVQEFNPSMNHLGIDIVAPEESPVKTVREGTVILARWNYEFGNMIVIQHPGNIVSIYKHNSLLLKKEGDRVQGGQVIAISGNTGEMTTGPHLHFELWINGAPVNPSLFLNY